MNVNVEDRLGALSESLAGVAMHGQPPAELEYARDGVVFATRPSADVIELRLGAEIAEAARRTPNVQPSARGDEWVHFAPAAWDAHAADRLEAWFRVAWRAAGKRG